MRCPNTLICAIALFALPIPTMAQETAQTNKPQPEKSSAIDSTKAASLPEGMERFSIDATHSTALFRVSHMGAGMFWGRFNAVSGSIDHDSKRDDGLRLEVSIAIDSVDSGSESLDTHIKHSDFFSAEEFPEATFKSTSSKRTSEHVYKVTGDLTMRGVTKAVTADVEWIGTSEMRGKRCGFETTFNVKRSDYGISYGIGGIGDDVRIVVSMEAVVPQPERQGRRARGDGGDENALPQRMAAFDTNEDGKLQKDELPERLQAMFDDADTNADGALDGKEIRAMRRGGRRRN